MSLLTDKQNNVIARAIDYIEWIPCDNDIGTEICQSCIDDECDLYNKLLDAVMELRKIEGGVDTINFEKDN